MPLPSSSNLAEGPPVASVAVAATGQKRQAGTTAAEDTNPVAAKRAKEEPTSGSSDESDTSDESVSSDESDTTD
jgi:hypothetical protein